MTKPRISPDQGTHHVILKGIDRADIFHNEEDKDFFLSLLARYCEKLSLHVSSYVLMDNHVHLTVKVSGPYPIGELVKRLCISYTQHYFNKKYDRQGSLFQSRFFSRVLRDEREYSTVVRYILLNPLKAGSSPSLDYRFSSYSETLAFYERSRKKSLCDFSDIKSAFRRKKDFIRFLNERATEPFFEEAFSPKNAQIREAFAGKDISDREALREFFLELFDMRVSLARLSRITGISRYSIKLLCS